MKPATVQEEFIPFFFFLRQLMNICSALVVTALWSVVPWMQRRAQPIKVRSSGAARFGSRAERQTGKEKRRANFLFASCTIQDRRMKNGHGLKT